MDITPDLPDFVITFRNNLTYSSSGGKELWVETSGGTWRFVSSDPNDASHILIGNKEIAITVTTTTLTLQFTMPDGSAGIGARTSGIAGLFELFFTR